MLRVWNTIQRMIAYRRRFVQGLPQWSSPIRASLPSIYEELLLCNKWRVSINMETQINSRYILWISFFCTTKAKANVCILLLHIIIGTHNRCLQSNYICQIWWRGKDLKCISYVINLCFNEPYELSTMSTMPYNKSIQIPWQYPVSSKVDVPWNQTYLK